MAVKLTAVLPLLPDKATGMSSDEVLRYINNQIKLDIRDGLLDTFHDEMILSATFSITRDIDGNITDREFDLPGDFDDNSPAVFTTDGSPLSWKRKDAFVDDTVEIVIDFVNRKLTLPINGRDSVVMEYEREIGEYASMSSEFVFSDALATKLLPVYANGAALFHFSRRQKDGLRAAAEVEYIGLKTSLLGKFG